MAESIASLTQKVADLQAAQQAEAARQIAQDAATATQVAALQTTIDTLNAAAGLSAENQALLDTAVSNIGIVIDALNAEQPTPVPPVPPAPAA